ncbi:MAG: hypothetical protein K5660_04090 [Paludibacteraceae bacterium]|nr:hypothetical protein [Paludibacteraceae bacterium]
MDKQSPQIQVLRSEIERLTGRAMKTPSDFDQLSLRLWDFNHEYLSPTTLKRLWGYIEGAAAPRYNTLSILARFLGYKEWDEFAEAMQKVNESESETFSGEGIRSDELQQGEEIEVAWQPKRRCIFRYDGNYRFTVIDSENSKLRIGDNFTAVCFLEGRPMYLDNLTRGNQTPKTYVAGKKNGISYARRIEK